MQSYAAMAASGSHPPPGATELNRAYSYKTIRLIERVRQAALPGLRDVDGAELVSLSSQSRLTGAVSVLILLGLRIARRKLAGAHGAKLLYRPNTRLKHHGPECPRMWTSRKLRELKANQLSSHNSLPKR